MIISYFFRLVVVLITFSSTIVARPYIVLSLQKPPLWVYDPKEPAQIDDFVQELCAKYCQKSAHAINLGAARAKLAKMLPHLKVNGFFAYYNGYIDCSNDNGIITFPITGHDAKMLNVLLCSQLDMRILNKNTIEAVAIPAQKRESAQLFQYKKITPQDKLPYWKVKQGTLPDDNIVTQNTVIILTNPKNIFIQEGYFYTSKSPHIALPENIFVVGNTDHLKIMLASLDIGRYFEEMRFQYAMPIDTILQRLPLNE